MGLNISQRKPKWIISQLPGGKNFTQFKQIKQGLKKHNLHTVCEEASCPNLAECWMSKTATVMILGDTCTRACKFCNTKTGNPKKHVDPLEVEKTAKMIAIMEPEYIVITSVDRDDLEDFGAAHFAKVITHLGKKFPKVKVEALIPDFCNTPKHMHTLAQSGPFVISHNIETTRRLSPIVRDRRAGYDLSLNVLKFYKEHYPQITTKSSILVGLGEKIDEVEQTLVDLKAAQVDILTIGQYLMPSKKHLAVERYYAPEEFAYLQKRAQKLGFKFVASGPMVRSSYKASDYLRFIKNEQLRAN